MKILILLVAVLVSACGSKSSPTAPGGNTTPPPVTNNPPPPAPTIGVLAGRITQSGPGSPLSNARVEIIGGATVGRSNLTNPNGEYTLADVNLGNNTIRVTKDGYISRDLGLVLNNVTNTQNVALQTVAPWSISGTGNNVFDVPTWITRVRVVGTFGGRCQNFVLWIRNDLVVNEILGTCSVAIGPRYDGVHLIIGGVSRTEISSGVTWSITEVR